MGREGRTANPCKPCPSNRPLEQHDEEAQFLFSIRDSHRIYCPWGKRYCIAHDRHLDALGIERETHGWQGFDHPGVPEITYSSSRKE
jgi:hypothetical protein